MKRIGRVRAGDGNRRTLLPPDRPAVLNDRALAALGRGDAAAAIGMLEECGLSEKTPLAAQYARRGLRPQRRECGRPRRRSGAAAGVGRGASNLNSSGWSSTSCDPPPEIGDNGHFNIHIH